MKLSSGEKLILAMLCELYKNLEIKGEFNPDIINEAISTDHHWILNWEYQM